MNKPPNLRAYWVANLRIVALLLAIWFFVAYVCSILLIEWLNTFQIGNVGLGFWMAQQGSIFTFVILVFVYAVWMDRIDRKFDVGE